jgi:hypothetical protein
MTREITLLKIQGNGIVKTILMVKHLGTNLKRHKILLCFDYQNGITNDEEYLMFINELDFFSIGTISLPLVQ